MLFANNTTQLVAFINRELDHLTDPDEGGSLSIGWQSAPEKGDVQELSDFAFTRYYNVLADLGPGDQWLALEASLRELQAMALFGTPV